MITNFTTSVEEFNIKLSTGIYSIRFKLIDLSIYKKGKKHSSRVLESLEFSIDNQNVCY